MIIWSGLGFLAPLIAILMSIITVNVFVFLTGNKEGNASAIVISLTIAAVLVWDVGEVFKQDVQNR